VAVYDDSNSAVRGWGGIWGHRVKRRGGGSKIRGYTGGMFMREGRGNPRLPTGTREGRSMDGDEGVYIFAKGIVKKDL